MLRKSRLTDSYTLRAGIASDWNAVARLQGDAFHERWSPSLSASKQALYEPERTMVALAGEEIVGSAGAYTRNITVPGGVLAAAHITNVAVHFGHRRRGLLKQMMIRQLSEAHLRNEPLAVLWASEGAIYQRFGYGLAITRLTLQMETPEVWLAAGNTSDGQVTVGSPDNARDVVTALYERARQDRPGWSSRDDRWWNQVLSGATLGQSDVNPLRVAVYEDEEGPSGYALWRAFQGWNDSCPHGNVVIRELVTTTTEAYVGLWSFLLDIDLTKNVQLRYGSPDEPLLYLVNEPRRLGARLVDQLWVRLVDLPAALASRRYPVPVDVVLQVTDELLPANNGRWHLVGDATQARCVATTRPADLAGDISAFGAAYLAGVSLTTLAAAGRVHELSAGTLQPVSLAFGWDRKPSTVETF